MIHISRSLLSPFFLYTYALILGMLNGFYGNEETHQLSMFLSDAFIRAFKCMSLPIIALSLIVTISTCGASQSLHRLWKRTLFYTIATTLVASTLACMLYCIIRPASFSLACLEKTIEACPQVTSQPIAYLKHLSEVIPTTLLAPFLEHQIIGVLVVSLLIGIALASMPEDRPKEALTSFFHGLHGLFLTITRWIVAIIPLGLFAFITVAILQIRQGTDLQGLGGYLGIIVAANLIQGFVILPLWLKSHRIAPFHAMKQMLPALSVAFFSKSSTGTLPLTMSTAEKKLGIPASITRFILPLCTTINMNGCAAFIFTTVIYVMQNNGVVLSWDVLVLWIGISTLAAIGNAGVPMGCFFLSTSLLASMDVPFTLLGLILPFYSLIDMLETGLNVWSDVCVLQVVHAKEQ